MATVEVTFPPLPAHVRTARLVATAVARRSGIDESLLDEVRLAVGEACSRAVEAHRKYCPGQPIRVVLCDDGERFEVVVTDAAPADADGEAPVAAARQGGNGTARGAAAGYGGRRGGSRRGPRSRCRGGLHHLPASRARRPGVLPRPRRRRPFFARR